LKHIKVEFMDNKTIIVHLDGILADSYSLCGDDTAGDDVEGWRTGYETIDPITCPACITIINYCKRVKKHQIAPSPKI